MVRLVAPAIALLFAWSGAAAAAPSCAERLLPPAAPPSTVQRPIEAEDLIELRDFGDPGQNPGAAAPFAVSPDGTRVALVIRRADIAANGYCYGILVVPLDGRGAYLVDVGGEPLIAMTDYLGMADKRNGVVTGSPIAWSPDGRSLAYLRREQGRTQLWVADAAGAAGRMLTDEPVDVRKFSWTADGRSIRFTTRPGIAAARAAIAREGETGFLYDERFWPNAAGHPLPGSDIGYVEQVIDVSTRAVRAFEAPAGANADPAGATLVARDGDRLAWTGARDPRAFLGPSKLSVRIGGTDRDCAFLACADRVVGIWWSSTGELLFLRDWGIEGMGSMTLYRWRPEAGPPSAIYTSDALLIGCRLRGEALICAEERGDQPRRLILLDAMRGTIRPLFDPNPEWRGVRLGTVTTLPAVSADGAKSFARLVLPPTHRPGERHPLIVVQYNSRGFLRGGTGDEYPIHLLAARGFAVLSFQRPRSPAADGRAGDVDSYVRMNLAGLAERRRIHSALEAAISAVVTGGVVDPARIGITGLSDGSSTVAFALLNSNRYRAAVLSTCCDEPSFTHSVAGRGYAAATQRWGYPAYGELGFWADYSLARNAARVRAPILIQAADEEFRVALDTVAALDAARRPVEMYVYPGEYHIKWQPRHRRVIYERVLDWFGFWLMGRTDPNPEKREQYARWTRLAALQPSPGAPSAVP